MADRESGIVWKRSSIPLCGDDEDVWDDTVLIKAYDRAVARIRNDSDIQPVQSRSKRKRKNRSLNRRKKMTWKVGSKCLSPYSGDGLYYEATILSIDIEAYLADVQYDHYGNTEKVDMSQLLSIEHNGKKSEMNCENKDLEVKTKMAAEEMLKQSNQKNLRKQWKVSDICFVSVKNEETIFKQAVINEFITSSICKVTYTFDHKTAEVPITSLFTASKVQRMYRASHSNVGADKKKEVRPGNYLYNNRPVLPSDILEFSEVPKGFDPPMFPPFLPQIHTSNKGSFLRNGSIPLPPPNLPPFPSPPIVPKAVQAGDEEALAGMLMSWYMSGYHTGYYQGMHFLNRDSESKKIKNNDFKTSNSDIKRDVTSEVETTDGEPFHIKTNSDVKKDVMSEVETTDGESSLNQKTHTNLEKDLMSDVETTDCESFVATHKDLTQVVTSEIETTDGEPS
ncbi:survival motor neuron protein isoform X1 [Hydra vulgaris]|uniref:survival motor neuron protein isoform X1 n=1 Tax=Hydra vulgaris TaxID=6087 RepID=UPI001F5EF801|nr:survival motor neuron protein [Hydra vulgaris]